MKVLIVENELYLAQSISNKLSVMEYTCFVANDVSNVDKNAHYDVLLLSTSIDGFERLIHSFKDSVIILLTSYISIDTVVNPLKAGALDYVQKPFMIEELIRKIEHFQRYKNSELMNKTYKSYIESHIKRANIGDFEYKKIKLPLMIKAHKQINADAFVFRYAEKNNSNFSCIDLSLGLKLDNIISLLNSFDFLFLFNLQSLKEQEQDLLLSEVVKKPVIIHTSLPKNSGIKIIDLGQGEKSLNDNEILTIDEYVKYIVTSYQNVFPDTDLSKKLGISRKSLWEKRKKYGLTKKK
ncbi:response regulator [uncultured Campylobacter sp.]|uniref:response regulator n=1 Tax=uncultured Campylobacter sp. TaxID=218934 RepID=UPI00260D03C4|nr:response regulator [uncultured Campylobacter sp.]